MARRKGVLSLHPHTSIASFLSSFAAIIAGSSSSWTGYVWSCDSCIPIPFPRLSEHPSPKDSPLTRRLSLSENNFPWIGRIHFHQPHADRAAKRNELLKQGKSLVSPAGRICAHPALALSPILFPNAGISYLLLVSACMGLLLARCPCLLHRPGLRAATEWSGQSLTHEHVLSVKQRETDVIRVLSIQIFGPRME